MWVEIDECPSATDGRIRLPGPAKHLRERLFTLEAQHEWLDLLRASEAVLEEHRFWLDLQRLSARSLIELGAEYRFAALAVREDALAFLERLPTLIDYRFEDGLPLANDDTRGWLRASTPPPPQELAAAPNPDSTDQWLVDLRRDWHTLIEAGKSAAAIELLSRRIETTSRARERFLIRWELARLLSVVNKVEAAIGQYQRLDHDMSVFSVQDWEPHTRLLVLRELFDMVKLRRSSASHDLPGPHLSLMALYQRLVVLDPSLATDIDEPL